jgi:hypothetical protein
MNPLTGKELDWAEPSKHPSMPVLGRSVINKICCIILVYKYYLQICYKQVRHLVIQVCDKQVLHLVRRRRHGQGMHRQIS